MNLLIDIGNTNIVMGVYDKAIKYVWRMETQKDMTAMDYGIRINDFLWEAGIRPQNFDYKVLSTVVPELKDVFVDLLTRLDSNPLVVLDSQSFHKLDIQIPTNEIGTDLVSNVLAATHIYDENLIIIDFGTALTFTIVNKQKQILGVNIAPGLKTAINVLHDKTAQLETVSLKIPASPLGYDTTSAIQNGVLLGYVGLVSYMIEVIKNEVGESYKVLATGGLSGVLRDRLPQIDYVNKDLTLLGLLEAGKQVLNFNQ